MAASDPAPLAASEPVASVNRPESVLWAAWPDTVPALRNEPVAALTLKVPAWPPALAAATDTELPAANTTSPVRESSVSEPASA